MAQRTDLDLDLEQRRRLLDEWVATRRQIAALEAQSYALLVERISVHDADVSESPHHRDAIYRSMIAEYSAAGHIPKGSVEYAFTDARTLSRVLPAVRASFAAGAITARHVREIVRASEIVDDAIRDGRVEPATMGLYEAAVLVVAEHDTASSTKAHARKVAARLVGQTVVESQRRAAAERCVTVRSVGDGLAALTAILPEWVAAAISDRLTHMARHIARTRDERAPILEVARRRLRELSLPLRSLPRRPPVRRLLRGRSDRRRRYLRHRSARRPDRPYDRSDESRHRASFR